MGILKRHLKEQMKVAFCCMALTATPAMSVEKPVTTAPYGHILTNANVWSPDSQWLVYDVRSDLEGNKFDGEHIEIVNIHTGAVKVIFTASDGAFCGVPTWHPKKERVVFILGPRNPTEDWKYRPAHRQGVWVDVRKPNVAHELDARDLTPPFTPGALRGGSHVHVWSADGKWVSFTYNDAILEKFSTQTAENDSDLRNVAVSIPERVEVSGDHPRNHSGDHFSVLVTRTTANPTPGSDEISRALEEGWVGDNGYLKPNGKRQEKALAFQGEVRGRDGKPFWEVFVADLPKNLRIAGDGPIAGTETKRPLPPRGVTQRRLTFTENETYPGIQGPRHWLKSSPDGQQIAFLRRDASGNAQIWTISPNGGAPRQITKDTFGIASTLSWSRDGRFLSYVADNSVFTVEAATGVSRRLTPRSNDADSPRPLSCVFSPDGKYIAYERNLAGENGERWNQIFIVSTS